MGIFGNGCDVYSNLNTNYFGVWEAIKLAHSEGYKIFDFGRTGINNDGLMSFKSRWGAKVVDLPILLSKGVMLKFKIIRKHPFPIS